MTSTILFNLMERNVWSCMLQMVNGLMSPAHGLLTSFVKKLYLKIFIWEFGDIYRQSPLFSLVT